MAPTCRQLPGLRFRYRRCELDRSPPFYWTPTWNILSRCHSIGRPHRIFSAAVIRLVARMEYSQPWLFYSDCSEQQAQRQRVLLLFSAPEGAG
eukprot:620857-Prorocentrum_minimum.AAC.2